MLIAKISQDLANSIPYATCLDRVESLAGSFIRLASKYTGSQHQAIISSEEAKTDIFYGSIYIYELLKNHVMPGSLKGFLKSRGLKTADYSNGMLEEMLWEGVAEYLSSAYKTALTRTILTNK